MTQTEIVQVAQAPLATRDEQTEVGQLVRLCLERDRDPGELMAVYREAVAMRAKREFSEALAKFRTICPAVPRRTPNSQFTVTVEGVKKPRMYADLDDIQSTIDPPLAECGLSYRWGDAVVANNLMTLSCILSHVGGHAEQSSVTVPTESAAGASLAQKWMSAGTYARRYSLIAVTGIKGCDDDDDGNGTAPSRECIAPPQFETLNNLMIELGDLDKAAPAQFLAWCGVGTLSQIPADEYEKRLAGLQNKVNKLKGIK